MFSNLVPPPRGVGVENFNSKCAQNFVFLYLGKVKKFQYDKYSRLGGTTNLQKRGRSAPPPQVR